MQQIPKNTPPRSLWMIWASCLINLYPAGWRERYADEILAILEEHPPTFWTLGDILISLCDAHLHSNMLSGRILGIFQQFYSSVTTIFSIGLMFCPFSFAILSYLTGLSGIPPLHGVPISPFFQPMLLVLTYQPYILLILLIICGISLFLSTGWQALKTHNTRSFFLYLFGSFSPLLAILFYAVLKTKLETYFVLLSIHRHILINTSLFFLFQTCSMLVSVLIVIAGIWALKVALRSTVPTIHLTNFLLVLATMISVLVFAYSSSLLFLIVYLFSSGFGTSIDLLSNGYLGLLFSVSILLTLFSLVRAHQAWRAFKIQAV